MKYFEVFVAPRVLVEIRGAFFWLAIARAIRIAVPPENSARSFHPH
jgi:hypothetical protein